MLSTNKSTNFLDLYLYHCGQSEVPQVFHYWAALSLIAACVQDRVWLERFVEHKSVPNLYVFLLAPSGVGKEKAINTAVKFVAENPAVNLYGGRATAPGLLDELGKRKLVNGKWCDPPSQLYLVTEELGMSMRSGEQADDFIKLLTKLYGRDPYVIKERTRLHGSLTLKNPTINWLAGSTEDWLVRSVPKDAIEGGFFARVVPVRAEKDYTVRHPNPSYPEDYAEVRGRLDRRVTALCGVTGQMFVSEAARAWHADWYMTRKPPEERTLEPTYNRGDEMIHKLAMLLALADWDSEASPEGVNFEIGRNHFEEALELWEGLSLTLPRVLRVAAATKSTTHLDIVVEILRRVGSLDHSTLLKRVYNRGMDAEDLAKAIKGLRQQQDITVQSSGRGTVYNWVGEVPYG